MGEKKPANKMLRINQKLVSMNLRRVLYSCATLFVLYPIFLLYTSLFSKESYVFSISIPITIAIEMILLAFLGMSYYALRTKENTFSNILIKSFWFFFLAFSMYLIYVDFLNNSGLTFYALSLGILSVVPLFNITERMYYTIIQAVFIAFVGIKFQVNSKAVFDIILLNLCLALLSRYLYVSVINKIQANDHIKTSNSTNTIDPLTKFYNRKGLENIIEKRWNECIMRRKRVSLLIIDIDNFKKFNSAYGYERGDRCIANIAENIQRIVLRDTDAIARLTGGRFVVFLTNTDEKEPVLLASKLRNCVEQMRIPLGENTRNGMFLTVSIGVSSMEPGNITTFSELYDEADSALYSAKEYGRNLIVYDEEIYGAKRIRRAT